MTGPQVWAMKVIAESAPIRVTDLARRMYLHPSTVVGILDRLELHDQVTRTRSEKDHRVVTVSLTAKGRETVSKVPQIAQGLLLKGLKDLSDRIFRLFPKGCGSWSASWAWKGCLHRSCCHRKSTRRPGRSTIRGIVPDGLTFESHRDAIFRLKAKNGGGRGIKIRGHPWPPRH